MTKPTRRQQAEWTRKLRASGFRDLESERDRDAPISNAGLLHAVTDDEEGAARLGHRLVAGQEYATAADSILHGHRFRSDDEREIWRRHAEGEGLREIATALGLSPSTVHERLSAVKRAVAADRAGVGRKGRQGRKWLHRTIAEVERPALLLVAALLLKARARRPSTPTRSSTTAYG